MIPAITASGKPERLALLIRMRDDKEYLVPPDNLPQLVEFAKTFNAEIHRVALEDFDSVLDLSEFPRALCDVHYRCRARYADLGRVLPTGAEPPVEHHIPGPRPEIVMNREMMRARADAVRKHIREQLLAGQVVSLQDLCDEFDGEGLSRTAMSNHFSRVRGELANEGRTIFRIGAGKYQLSSFAVDAGFFRTARYVWGSYPPASPVGEVPATPPPTGGTTIAQNDQWVIYENIAN